MKKNAKQKFYKKAIVALIVVLLCNFSFSNTVFASQTDRAKNLLNPIAAFFCAVGDITIGLLQKNIQGELAIVYSDTNEYVIKYSPGIILSGTLPVFNINFIGKPTEDSKKYNLLKTEEEVKTTAVVSFRNPKPTGPDDQNIVTYKTTNNNTDVLTDIINKAKGIKDEIEQIDKTTNEGNKEENKEKIKEIIQAAGVIHEEDLIDKERVIDYIKTYQMDHKYNDEETTQKIENIDMLISETPQVYSSWLAQISDDKWEQYTVEISHKVEENNEPQAVIQIYEVKITINTLEKISVIASIAKILRSTVASWYRAMQEIALVGLLLVLTYMAIRMIINSSVRGKSKI